MARLRNDGALHGRIGEVVYRTLDGKQIVQGKPRRVKQTANTKLKALEHGVASHQAGRLKQIFAAFQQYLDPSFNGRFAAAIARCMESSYEDIGERHLQNSDPSRLNYFSFNKESNIENILLVEPELHLYEDGEVELILPITNSDDELRCPYDASYKVRISITVIAADLLSNWMQVIDMTDFEFILNPNPQPVHWISKRKLNDAGIVFILFSIQFLARSWGQRDIQTKDKKYMPGIILKAFRPSEEMLKRNQQSDFEAPISKRERHEFGIKSSLSNIKSFLQKTAKDSKKSDGDWPLL